MNAASTHSSKPALRWLLRRARTARLWIVLSVSLGFGSGVLLITQAALIAQLLQAVFIDARPRSELTGTFVLFAMVVAGRALMAWGREMAGFQAGARVRTDVRRDLLAHMTAAGPALTRQEQTGALASTVVEQVEALHNFFAHYLPQLGLAVLIPVSIVAVVFPVSWTAGAILAGTAPLIPLFMVLIGMGAESISQRQFQALSRMSGHFLDVLQGLPTLKRFRRSKAEAERVAKVSHDYRLRTMSVLRVAFLSSAVLEFFSSVSIALVAVYLGTHFLGYIDFGSYGSPLTLGAGLFILVLAPDFYLPLRELGTHYHARAEAAGAAEAILQILDTPLPAQAAAVDTAGIAKPIEIVFDEVGFAYASRPPYLFQNVSFTVRSGEKLTLAGASGVGKSTLLDLLMGFEQPSQGTITINGTPLPRISHQDWRNQLAWVGQQPLLFYGSLHDNIRLGCLEAGAPAIRAAARAAKVLEFADRMPQGLDTPVGEKGHRLSRGQAQRVALARAFLADAPLLLLDEPTAGLDAANERLVVEAIDRLSHGRTVIMVTHRMANVRDNDRILTLAGGGIAEDGCYRDLMAARGPLFNLLQSPVEARNHG